MANISAREQRRLRVALVGLGDIARKAYLPVLAARPDVELHLVTRNAQARNDIGEMYRVATRSTSVAEAITAGLDAAFVHAATTAHAEIVTELLSAGVPVYVDKPLTDTFASAEALVNLAEQRGVTLMVGFNRRFAPAYAALHNLPSRDLVIMQKHRRGQGDTARRVIFDDFIHVLDTLRFLAPGPVDDVVIGHGSRDGRLEHVVVHLIGRGFSCTGAMHRNSGATEETLDVVGGGRRVRVVDVGDVIEYDDTERLRRREPWASAPYSRGFVQACDLFLTAVKENRMLSARDALGTHALCERVVSTITAAG